MVVSPPLVRDGVWLDKPKYDEAERRYYVKLAKSIALAKSGAGSTSMNDSVIPNESDLANEVVSNKSEELEIKADLVEPKVTAITEKVCELPAGSSVCKKPNKTAQVKHPKEVILPNGNNVSSFKPELPQKCNMSPEDSCLKAKVVNKSSKNTQASPVTNTVGSGTESRGQITEVCKIDDIAVTSNNVGVEVANRVISLEKENQELTSRMEKLEQRIAMLEKQLQQTKAAAATTAAPVCKKPAPQPPKPTPPADDDDDGVDLFGSDSEEEDAEAAKIKEQRLAEYAAKKSKKPTLIAKSSIILDVKPWDDETDMKKLEEEVRKIGTDGLLWGASKLVPLAYGIHKLQISCVVEDEKVSVDWLQETIQEIEDYVQSVDIAAFNKI